MIIGGIIKRLLVSLLILGLLAGCNNVKAAEPTPQASSVFYHYIYIEVPKYIDRIETKYVVKAREFTSVAEAEAWYQTKKDLLKGNHCTDYAKQLQALAFEDGFYMSVCLMKDGAVYYSQIMNENIDHAGNLFTIGRVWYYLEPIPAWHCIIQVCETY